MRTQLQYSRKGVCADRAQCNSILQVLQSLNTQKLVRY